MQHGSSSIFVFIPQVSWMIERENSDAVFTSTSKKYIRVNLSVLGNDEGVGVNAGNKSGAAGDGKESGAAASSSAASASAAKMVGMVAGQKSSPLPSFFYLEFTLEVDFCMRGGLLADKVGFGKTSSFLALLQFQSDPANKQPDPTTTRSEDIKKHYINAPNTTLILVPSNLLKQWKQEIEVRVMNLLNL